MSDMAKDAAKAKRAMNASKAQRRVIDAIRSGSLKQAWTGSIDGNIVQRLIRSGAVTAEHVVVQKAERTYWGKRIPQCINYIGLKAA